MVLTLIHLLQSHPPAKVSWLLWTVAILFFLIGLALLIYLMTRPKETETEELEDAGSRGLLAAADQEPEKPQAEPEALSSPTQDAEPSATIPLFSEADFQSKRETEKAFVEPLSKQSAPVIESAEALPLPQTQSEEEATALPDHAKFVAETQALISDQTPAQIDQTPVAQETPVTGTQILTSPSPAEAASPTVASESLEEPAIPVATANMASSALQEDERSSQDSYEDIFSPQEEALRSQSGQLPGAAIPTLGDTATREFTSFSKEQAAARLEAPASQARFEPAAKPRREPFEPPTITMIAPKAAATEEPALQTTPIPSNEKEGAQTTILSSQGAAKQPPSAQVERRFAEAEEASSADQGTTPLSSAPTSFKASPKTSPQAAPLWETQGSGLRSLERKPAGSVLGIPAETSHAPLILGQSSHGEEGGVAALTNYGKDLDAADTGRGGAIALMIALLIVGGSLLAYFFIPSVHSYTNNLVARIRGEQSAPPVVEKPKAQIYPSRTTEVNKNMVKARGAVTNISEEPLEGLQVEVSLDRGEGTAAEIRTVAVNPSLLAPRQQGLYELEYEGSKATGFSRYKVIKLLSKTGEVKFTTPNQ
jgi:hypothetical protein